MDAILKGNIDGLPKLEQLSLAGIYIVHSLFHAVSVAIVINPSTGHDSPKFHVVFDDAFSTVAFMRKDKIPPNLIDLVQRRSKRYVPENIDLKDTWFTTDLEEYTREPQTHVPIVPPENNRNIITPLQPLQQV